ncbi:MAG: efflux RND transporter permease subunit [Planctomycetota bacterium]
MGMASFGVRKPVVANLVMFALLGAGLIFGSGLTREFFPEVRPNLVIVSAPYPGAAPDEVEDALAIKIEDQLAELSDIVEINSTVTEGSASVTVEYQEGSDIDAAVAEVKREVDALQDLPEGADRIVVQALEPNLPAIVVSIFGNENERDLKDAIRDVRDDLRTLSGMGKVQIGGIRVDEISVEVRAGALLEWGLGLSDVGQRISAAMRELPGGTVRTDTGNFSLRSVGIDEDAQTVRDIVVATFDDGRVVKLSDIAEITNGFADTPLITRLNGLPAVNATVFKEGDDDIVTIAEMVKAYVAGRNGESYPFGAVTRLLMLLRPPGSETPVGPIHEAYLLGQSRADEVLPGTLTTTTDLARFVVGRLDLLTRNAFWGGVLVFLTLVVLLNWRVAFWVAAGLIVSLAGTLVMMRFAGVSLNLLSMFGLIIVIGILVDDAIVVAENITARHEAGEPALLAAVSGTGQVNWPVVATVMTTIAAFMPLGLLDGQIGDFMSVLPVVVACSLIISLVESLFILPSHMGHSLKHADERDRAKKTSVLAKLEHASDRFRVFIFDDVVGPAYAWLLKRALKARYTSLAIGIATVIVSGAMFAGGHVEFVFFEDDDAETVDVQLTMPIGTPLNETDAMARRLEDAVRAQAEVASFYTNVGSSGALDGSGGGGTATHIAQLVLELYPVEFRDRTSQQVIQGIRDAAGELSGVKSLRMEGVSGGPGGAAISFTVVGDNQRQIEAAADRIMAELDSYEGVVDISSNAEGGQREVRFELLPGAERLGFTRESLGRQIQGFAFGIEAFTFAGEREDVDVRVQLPEELRRNIAALERQYVFAPDGTPVPISEVAKITEAEGYTTIRRLDRERSVAVQADVNRALANPNEVVAAILPAIEQIESDFAGIRILQKGRQEEQAESFASLPIGMAAAAGLIYVILAWLFGSYTQPLIVMSAIPFAVIGMIWGHIVLGYSLTFLSLIGFVALAGVVVNDSLIFMEFFNHERRAGKTTSEAAYSAGRARVRAILLTTVTTVLGLTPLLLEQSFQARFLIPMGITIAAGLVSATGIILLILPCLLVILRDIKFALTTLWTGEKQSLENDIWSDPAAEFDRLAEAQASDPSQPA